jgi:hypothetical protein
MDWVLTGIAEDHIQDLKKNGVEVTPQEVLEIQRLSLDCEKPDENGLSLARGTPVMLGDEVFYPLTLAGQAFVEEVGSTLTEDGDELLVVMFAARFGRDRNVIYARGKEAQTLYRQWKRRLRCTIGELLEAAKTLAEDNSPHVEGDDDKVKDMSLLATALCGGKPEEWETQIALRSVYRLINIVWKQRMATSTSAKHDPRIEASRRLGRYCLDLLNKRKAASNG